MGFGKSFILSFLVGATSVWAVRAAPFLINSTQPDGSVVQIRKMGDEHFHYTLTGEDSVLVVRDSVGYWNYADENGKKTGMRVHAKSKRGKKELDFLKKRDSRKILQKFRERGIKKVQEQRELDSSSVVLPSSNSVQKAWGGWNFGETTKNTNWPTRPVSSSVKKTGEVRGIVILVQFSDVKFSRSDAAAEYYDYLNKEGYSENNMSGSVRDFFVKNSSGQYKPTFDVYGPITVKGTRDSYGVLAYSDNEAKGAAYAVSEAMDQLVAQNVDFSVYDSDGDKVVDFVYMIYAGVGSADSDVHTAIWPHSYSVGKRLTRNYYMNKYACSPEIDGQAYMRNKKTNALHGIGTFCHEFSHVLGLQDHYDVSATDRRSGRYTPSYWDLMDAGSYDCPTNTARTTACSPANLSAFERYTLGWLEPRRLEVSDTTFVLKTIDENDGLVLTSNNDNEYYFLDFRLQQGFDRGLPGKGLLIWHIYYEKIYWQYNQVNASDPMHVDLIEADGKADLTTIANDAFPTNRVNSYNGFVTWAGDSLGLGIYDIKIVDDHVTFETRGSRVSPDAGKSSSSNAKSSSSKKAESSSSSAVKLSSASVTSSSNEVSSSSASEGSSSSNSLLAWTMENSSSSADVMSMKETFAGSAVRFAVTDGVLRVNAKFDGRKTVRLFDVNGSLLLTKSFNDQFCEIQMESLPQKSFVVGTLELGGRVIKTLKLRLN